jgi:hypothetical protein
MHECDAIYAMGKLTNERTNDASLCLLTNSKEPSPQTKTTELPKAKNSYFAKGDDLELSRFAPFWKILLLPTMAGTLKNYI